MLTRDHLAWALALLLSTVAGPAWADCLAGDEHTTVGDQFLRLRKVADTFSTRFYYIGTLPGPTGPIDPIATGLRLVVAVPGAGIETIDVTIPPGAYNQIDGLGWSTGHPGTYFYRDSLGNQKGIMRVLVKQVASGDLKISLFGQNGNFPLPLTETEYPVDPVNPGDDPCDLQIPIAATVMLPRVPPATTDLCGEGALTVCRYRNQGRKLLCN